jgi:hypothetical protein
MPHNNRARPLANTVTDQLRALGLVVALTLASAMSAAAQAPAPAAAASTPPAVPAPITLGGAVFNAAVRTRTYGWNWFGDNPGGDYVYQGTQVRFGLSRSKPSHDWQLEFEAPFMLGLPDDAVTPPPQGQLGLGAAYVAANDGSTNPAALFLKQAFIRFKGLGGVAGQSIKIGRTEFNDGTEVAPRNATLATLKRDRISQRVLGNFGFSDVLRSLDAVHYVLSTPTLNVTAIGGRPTEGVFQVNGWAELDINVIYGAVTKQIGSDRNPGEWRLFGMWYDDYRDGVVKTDNRPAAVRNTDFESIGVTTAGAHYLQAVTTAAGPLDILLWGAWQTGSWGTQSHRGGAYAVEGGWQPKVLPGLKPWIRGGYNYGSGDDDPADDTHRTFFQMLPTARIYARTPFFNMMNNTDAFGQLVLRPHARVTLRTDVHVLGLADRQDLWYSGGGAFESNTFGFAGRPSNNQTDLATLYDASADFVATPRLNIGLYYGHASSGGVTRAIYPNDSNGHLGYLELLLRF